MRLHPALIWLRDEIDRGINRADFAQTESSFPDLFLPLLYQKPSVLSWDVGDSTAGNVSFFIVYTSLRVRLNKALLILRS